MKNLLLLTLAIFANIGYARAECQCNVSQCSVHCNAESIGDCGSDGGTICECNNDEDICKCDLIKCNDSCPPFDQTECTTPGGFGPGASYDPPMSFCHAPTCDGCVRGSDGQWLTIPSGQTAEDCTSECAKCQSN